MNKIESIAIFLIMLIVSLPLYAADVNATINSVSTKGSSGVEGVVKKKDSILFTVIAKIANDPTITSNQVRLGTTNNFERCVVTTNNDTECTKRVGDNSSTLSGGAIPYTINLYKDDGSIDSSVSHVVIVDGKPPAIAATLPKNDFSGKEQVVLSLVVTDTACDGNGCSGKCAGVKNVEVIVNGSTSRQSIESMSNNTNGCIMRATVNINPSSFQNGRNVLIVKATDKFDQSSESTNGLTVDNKAPEILVNSFLILRNGVPVTAIGPRDIPVEVFVNISGSDLDPNSVFADLRALNSRASYSNLKAQCTSGLQVNTCRWGIVMNSGSDTNIGTSASVTTPTGTIPTTPTTGTTPIPTPTGGSAPNRLAVVQSVHAGNPSLIFDAHAFTNAVACRLWSEDPRWGRNGKRGNVNDLSDDAISYRGTSGPGGVDIIDIIGAAGGPNPQPAWIDVTEATRAGGTIGAWVQPSCSGASSITGAATAEPGTSSATISTAKGDIIINASDLKGNKASILVNKQLREDAKGPVVSSLVTQSVFEGKSYAKASGNTVTAVFNEDTGLNAPDIKLHIGSSVLPASSCRKTNVWTCTWAGVTFSASSMSIESDSTDILLNPVEEPKRVDVIVDNIPPVVTGISVISIGNIDDPTLFKVEDKISVVANITELNELSAIADFSRFIRGATNVSGNCKKIDAAKNECTWVVGPIDIQATGDIGFIFSDRAGNQVAALKSIQALGLDSTSSPDYWSNTILCSPRTIDRQLGPFVNQRMYCEVRLNPKIAGVSTLSVSAAKCSSSSIVQSIDTQNKQRGSTSPLIKITLKKDDFRINEENLRCSFDIFTRRGDTVTKNPEIETADIKIQFYNNPLGEISEEVERKIQEAKDDAQGIWKLVGTLDKIVKFATKICQLIHTFYQFVAVLHIATTIVKKTELTCSTTVLGEATGVCSALYAAGVSMCGGAESAGGAAKGIKAGLNKFCDFVTCRQAQFWGKDVEKWINELPLADWIGKTEDGNTVFRDPADPKRSYSLDPQGRPLSTYLNPRENLAVATLYGCIPGIISGLDKMRQIKCLYADCLINAVGKDGLPITVCEDQKKYATCKYVTGEIFAVVPYTAMFDHFTGIIKEALSNPFTAIGISVSVYCGEFCSIARDGGFKYNFCAGARLFSLVGDAAENVRNIINDGFKPRQDYCSRLDFDEESEDNADQNAQNNSNSG